MDQEGVDGTLNSQSTYDAFTHELGHALELPHPFEQKDNESPNGSPHYKLGLPNDGDPCNVMNYEAKHFHFRFRQTVAMAQTSFIGK
jgi:hypothetical protein